VRERTTQRTYTVFHGPNLSGVAGQLPTAAYRYTDPRLTAAWVRRYAAARLLNDATAGLAPSPTLPMPACASP
jgi:hypothetical protein